LIRLKHRQRLLGNMKFVGELFNKNMLTVSVIFYCARILTSGLRSDHLEAVCTLLEVTGATLDSSAMKTRQSQVREIFQRLTTISNMSPSSSEVR
jgi:MIF4G domain-containing protein